MRKLTGSGGTGEIYVRRKDQIEKNGNSKLLI